MSSLGAVDLFAVANDRSPGGVEDPGQHVQDGGFAAPAGPDHGHELASRDGEVDVLDGKNRLVFGVIAPEDEGDILQFDRWAHNATISIP